MPHGRWVLHLKLEPKICLETGFVKNGEQKALLMSGGDIDTIINNLFAYGFNRPDSGEDTDMVISSMMSGTSFMPSWLELVDVAFFDETHPPVKAWKKKGSGVYKLLNFEADIALPTKGYECDWSPHIGEIS